LCCLTRSSPNRLIAVTASVRLQGHAFGALGRPARARFGHGNARALRDRVSWCRNQCQSQMRSGGISPTPGRGMPHPDGREPSGGGAATQVSRSAPAGRQPRSNAPKVTATASTDRAVLLAPGILSPRKRSQSRPYVLFSLRALHLDSDLPGQDLGTYQEDGGGSAASSIAAAMSSRSCATLSSISCCSRSRMRRPARRPSAVASAIHSATSSPQPGCRAGGYYGPEQQSAAAAPSRDGLVQLHPNCRFCEQPVLPVQKRAPSAFSEDFGADGMKEVVDCGFKVRG
jgi:hypothetical protein